MSLSGLAAGQSSAVTPSSTSAPKSGATELARGHAAWLRGEFDSAEFLFNAAITKGHLKKAELVDAWSSLGAARTVRGNKEGALTAFRRAATLEPKFPVADEAGKRASQLADQARAETKEALEFRIEFANDIRPNEPFSVNVTMHASHMAYVSRVVTTATLAPAAKSIEFPPSEKMSFQLPKEFAVVDTVTTVDVRGFDVHDNEVIVDRFRVMPKAPIKAKRPVDANDRIVAGEPPKPEAKPGKPFFSTAWPWVIGGTLVAGAAAGFLFYQFGPAQSVTLQEISVVPR